jgi:hypothetical protein
MQTLPTLAVPISHPRRGLIPIIAFTFRALIGSVSVESAASNQTNGLSEIRGIVVEGARKL